MTKAVHDDWLEDVIETVWVTPDVVAFLLDESTTFDPETDTFVADIAGGDRNAGPIAVSGKSADGSWAKAANIEFEPAEGAVSTWVVVAVDTGSEATSRIIASANERLDGNPLSVTGNGGVVELAFTSLRWLRL